MQHDWVHRKILVPLLVFYVVMLVVAAWRHEIRPAAMDGMSESARSLLAFAGIPPGVAVFSADTAFVNDSKIVSLCVEVQSLGPPGLASAVYPMEGVTCPAPAPRLWVRGEDIFLQRALVSMRAAAAARRRGDDDPSRARFARLLARSIGAHFALREALVAEDSQHGMLLWTEERVSYETGARSSRDVALMHWQKQPDPRVFIAWQPSEAVLRERGWDANLR